MEQLFWIAIEFIIAYRFLLGCFGIIFSLQLSEEWPRYTWGKVLCVYLVASAKSFWFAPHSIQDNTHEIQMQRLLDTADDGTCCWCCRNLGSDCSQEMNFQHLFLAYFFEN